jgi:hypothetical protein
MNRDGRDSTESQSAFTTVKYSVVDHRRIQQHAEIVEKSVDVFSRCFFACRRVHRIGKFLCDIAGEKRAARGPFVDQFQTLLAGILRNVVLLTVVDQAHGDLRLM